jgi:hypothetical protein
VIPKRRRSRKVTIRMRDELYAKFQRRAHDDGISESATACQLIARGLREEPPTRPQDAPEPEGEA